jgi:hypothetical protein
MHRGRNTRGENWMLCKWQSKESAVFSIILRRFLVIFSTTTFISFTKLKIRRSFWGAEQVSIIIGSKVMAQNAMQAKKSRSFTVGVSFRLSSYYSLIPPRKSRRCSGLEPKRYLARQAQHKETNRVSMLNPTDYMTTWMKHMEDRDGKSIFNCKSR